MSAAALSEIVTEIITQAKNFGATLAGITSVASLYDARSYKASGYQPNLPENLKSVLVLALAHPQSDPEMDWWDTETGLSPGTQSLIEVTQKLKPWLQETYNMQTRSPGYIEDVGPNIFAKEVAVRAGLGTIGRNNLLVTPQFGSRVRLATILLDIELPPTGPIDFDPCATCDMRCRRACPQRAFESGSYTRASCKIQIQRSNEDTVTLETAKYGATPRTVIKYCRNCELACPVGNETR